MPIDDAAVSVTPKYLIGRAIGYHSDQRVRWIVVDVRGEAIIVELVGPVAQSSFSSSVAGAQPIVDSLRFGEAR